MRQRKKREEMEKCQEGTPEMKRKREEKGRKGKKNTAVRGWKRMQDTNAQSGSPGAVISEITAYCHLPLPISPETENFCICFNLPSHSRTAII